MADVDSTRRGEAVPAPDTRPGPPSPTASTGPMGIVTILGWVLKFALSLFLFVGALQIMKEGAAALDVLSEDGWLVKNPGSTLGLGWIGALFVLSGSPIAASALTLVAAGSITSNEGFTMVTGSRVGAAFVVLLVAVIYALRGGKGARLQPVSTAVITLTTTAIVYLPGSVIGYGILEWGPFKEVDLSFPAGFSDLIDIIYGPSLDRIAGWPPLLLFAGGLGILLLAFKLIDNVVPEMSEEKIEHSRALMWLRRKWPMFGLGCLVALVTMSVSVALTVLVPLVSKRYVKREHIFPYIMGANITTLGDTLLAAFLLDSSDAVRIVLASIAGSTIVSLVLLTFFYPQMRSLIWRFQRQVVASKPRLAAFTAGLFLAPLALIAFSGLMG